jgi:hypothetical protein
MRARPLTLIAIACTASAVVLVPSASAAWKQLPSSAAVHAAAAAPPRVVLRRAEQAFEKRPPTGVKRDVSPLLRRLAVDLPRLRGAERRRAARLLARPSDELADPQQNGWSAPEAAGSPVCSAHFCVHWVASGPDAPNLTDANGNSVPDWVETVSATAENVYSVENGQLGWRRPKSDGSRGGGGPNLTDVYLADVGGSGIYGYSAPDPQGQSHSLFAYLVLDNDFDPSQFRGYSSPVEPLDVTLAHEYNHVLQFNYDALEDTWMLESTAVWMEGKVYEPVHDYLQYLPGWVQLTQQPITSFDGNDPNSRTNVKVYGSAVWNKWLDQRYGEEIVRRAWEDSVQAGSFGPAAYDAAIRQHGGAGFSDEFDRFVTATAEWQAPNSGFPEGGLYPEVRRAGELPIDGSPGTIALDHAAYVLVNVPVTSAPQIRLAVGVPRGTTSALALVGLAGGSVVQAERSLPKGGHGVVTLANPGNLSRLTAVLVNSDVKHGGFSSVPGDWAFKRDNQRFYAHPSTDFTAPRVASRAATRKKVTVTFSEPMLGVARGSFKLAGVSTRLKFKLGARTATLVPRHALRPGRYSALLTSAITDLTFNPLRAAKWSFSVH